MKKISIFMASILLFLAVAVIGGPTQEVQAFSDSEVNYSDFKGYCSSKAGEEISYYYSLDYETAATIDITGWKVAICPENDLSLNGAVAVYELTNDNKYINTEFSYANIRLSTTLASDIPSGLYKKVLFDAEGNVVSEDYSAREYVNKSLVYFSASVMNNDGYVYAYTYEENMLLNASTYPTFYAVDQATAVTSFSDYTTEVNQYGYKVHIYRLNILDQSAFTMTDGTYTNLYYKVGTPNASNDGGIGLASANTNGLGLTSVVDLNTYIQKYSMECSATSPFNQSVTSSDTSTESNSTQNTSEEKSDAKNIQPAVSVGSVQSSNIPEVQSAIEALTIWVGRITTDPADVMNALKQYAPALNVTSITAGGVLEVSITNGADISGGKSITFSDENIAANVKSGDTIALLHVKHDGSIEYLPAVAGDGTITATFTSLSPVAWFKVNTGTDAVLTSPKTGESFWDFLFGLFH